MNGPRLFTLAVAVLLAAVLQPIAGSLLVREPPPPAPPANSSIPRVGHFNARINNFDASNTKIFRSRFFFQPNTSEHTDHVLVMVGGPWEISRDWLQSGLVTDLAESLGQIATFYLEHRYYGGSIPPVDSSLESLRYLNADQVLGDIAHFIQHIRSVEFQNGIYSGARITLVGCSVGASLSHWMRVGYPHLVDYVVSDSAPIKAIDQFPEYMESLTETIRREGGENCVATIEEALTALDVSFDTVDGLHRLSTRFNTCEPLYAEDAPSLYWYGVIEPLATLVQSAGLNDIAQMCIELTHDPGTGNSLQRLVTLVNNLRGAENQCLEANNTNIVNNYREEALTSPYYTRRLWLYQTCIQYGWNQVTTTQGSLFFNTIPTDFFHNRCRDVFGDSFTPEFIRRNIDRTNLFFSGFQGGIPNGVISTTSDLWSRVSVDTGSNTFETPVQHLTGFGQCQVLRPMSESYEVAGMEEIHSAKFNIQRTLLRWIRDIHINGASQITQSALAFVAIFAVVKNLLL